MLPFEQLVAEAVAADVDGWGFGWLDGRATEERPPWGYARLLAERVGAARAPLDLDTGGGEVLDEAPTIPVGTVATEGWPANLALARARLRPRGVDVREHRPGSPLPVADASRDLVTSRHPLAPDFAEIARVLEPGGAYFAQHVGPWSAAELSERFLGPLPGHPVLRDPATEILQAQEAGLELVAVQSVRLRQEYADIGAIVWILRKCPWWVPGFDPTRADDATVRALDRQLRASGPFVAHASRHLLELRKSG
ncbi:methyltransferase domain-containing protein [Agrococcus sp. 1P02AA]|uniref:class I SAM-dependent methyltransferase n=1 Tax=Agrococcus sp. 1P02AA TaxID=3132259 RepID=UPI0039A53556